MEPSWSRDAFIMNHGSMLEKQVNALVAEIKNTQSIKQMRELLSKILPWDDNVLGERKKGFDGHLAPSEAAIKFAEEFAGGAAPATISDTTSNSSPQIKRGRLKRSDRIRPLESSVPSGLDLLAKFKKAIQISQRIEMGSLATMLGIPKEQLLAYLLEWADQVDFKIDKDLIIVQDVDVFTSALDKAFAAWGDKEKRKDGKT
jgi:hypothetical protein